MLDEAKPVFATVSHELRAPLTSIEGYIEMLRDGRLAIVRTIVARHGGEIDLRSQQDVGTVATVRFPMLATPGGYPT